MVTILGSQWLSKYLPEGLKKMHIAMKLLKLAKYDIWPMFDQLGCDKIYEVSVFKNKYTFTIRPTIGKIYI